MINKNIKKSIAFAALTIVSLIIVACTGGTASNKSVNTTAQVTNSSQGIELPESALIGKAQTPTEAFKALYAAVKSKKTDEIKKMMSKSSTALIEMQASQSKQSQDQVYSNGLTATTMAATMPEIRDERVKDNFGAVEVWNATANKWDDVPFIKEDGNWKLAVGDIFQGTYQSPGMPQAFREREAANAANPNSMQIPKIDTMNVNVNRNVQQPPMPSKKEMTVPTPKR